MAVDVFEQEEAKEKHFFMSHSARRLFVVSDKKSVFDVMPLCISFTTAIMIIIVFGGS
jgi:hypothetical protein